jgi:hypothetical protein
VRLPTPAAGFRALSEIGCGDFARHSAARLGASVQALIAWVRIFDAMPAVGLGVLDLARGIAALRLWTIAFFAGT